MTPKLTNAGVQLLLRALAGETIKFTKMQLGNGEKQDEKNAVSLGNPLITIPFTEIKVGDNYATLTATLNNSTIESGFRVTEVGFFAEDLDDANNEILYALGVEDKSTADYVPDNTNRVFEMEFEALIFVGEAENVTAAINSSLVYTSKKEFETHTFDTNNPHEVTKAQVGLGNVPNVSTNDQTPTYDEAKSLVELVSGEKMSVLISKVAFAVKQLISHVKDKKNPHNLNAKDLDAAESDHTHSASDINSGTLSIERGGTGATNKESALKNLGGCQFFCGSYAGNGKFGSENPNSLTFDFAPQIVIVQAGNGQIVIMRKGIRQATVIGAADTNVYLNTIWSENTLTWYNDTSAVNQFNVAASGYYYTVFG